MDYTTLLGFPPEIVIVAIIAYSVVKIVELIANRKKDKTEVVHKDEQSSDK